VRESRRPGSAPGAAGNSRPYRNRRHLRCNVGLACNGQLFALANGALALLLTCKASVGAAKKEGENRQGNVSGEAIEGGSDQK
jgi:hypothetical protein